ncbi:hypothetical protein ARMSODRAFT_983929 [Armillaria solidipes]|uniref:Uncharacterized protein n=1 Tax=Armillaria solidipes TaxID=1076256 RepID=A0A2H3AH69_9AGAR|nr:hypothetical protein ARMSODRAFT_983929 [Armillaria solidipes]
MKNTSRYDIDARAINGVVVSSGQPYQCTSKIIDAGSPGPLLRISREACGPREFLWALVDGFDGVAVARKRQRIDPKYVEGAPATGEIKKRRRQAAPSALSRTISTIQSQEQYAEANPLSDPKEDTPDLLRGGRWSQWRDDRLPRIQFLICFRIPEMEKTQAVLRILLDTLRDRRVSQPRHPRRGLSVVSSIDAPCARDPAHGRLYGSLYEDRLSCPVPLGSTAALSGNYGSIRGICIPRFVKAKLRPNVQSFDFMWAHWRYLRQATSGHAEGGMIENGWSAVRLRSPVEELEDTSGDDWNGK